MKKLIIDQDGENIFEKQDFVIYDHKNINRKRKQYFSELDKLWKIVEDRLKNIDQINKKVERYFKNDCKNIKQSKKSWWMND